MKKALLFFPGWASIDASYYRVDRDKADGWQVVIVPYSRLMKSGDPQELLKTLPGFLKEQHLQRVYVAGHSMGGLLALLFAAQHPSTVAHLYLINAAGVYGQETIVNRIRAFSISNGRFFRQHPLLLLKSTINLLTKPRWQTKLARFSHLSHVEETAKQLQVTTTILWGDNDLVMPLWQGEMLSRWIAGSRLIVIPKGEHDWVLQNPQPLWKELQADASSVENV